MSGRCSSRWSLWSEDSFLSIASKSSVLSVSSVGSCCSVGSVGSFASCLSVGSACSFGSLMSWSSRGSVMSSRSCGAVMGEPVGPVAPIIAGAALVGVGLILAAPSLRVLRRGCALRRDVERLAEA